MKMLTSRQIALYDGPTRHGSLGRSGIAHTGELPDPWSSSRRSISCIPLSYLDLLQDSAALLLSLLLR